MAVLYSSVTTSRGSGGRKRWRSEEGTSICSMGDVTHRTVKGFELCHHKGEVRVEETSLQQNCKPLVILEQYSHTCPAMSRGECLGFPSWARAVCTNFCSPLTKACFYAVFFYLVFDFCCFFSVMKSCCVNGTSLEIAGISLPLYSAHWDDRCALAHLDWPRFL